MCEYGIAGESGNGALIFLRVVVGSSSMNFPTEQLEGIGVLVELNSQSEAAKKKAAG